jgi:hypothetical protein
MKEKLQQPKEHQLRNMTSNITELLVSLLSG